MTENANDFALVVGINHYPEYRPLAGAIKDAQQFAKWLVAEPAGGGLPAANCKVVLSQENPTRPIQDDIDEMVAEILTAVGAGPARRLYLYFSGHGLARQNVGADLCLAKWSSFRRNMALDSEAYLNLMMTSGKFAEVVFLLDCCRVRKVAAKGLPCTYGLAAPAEGTGASRSFVAYATEFLNAAYEAEVGGVTDPASEGPVVRGHFTQALLAGLRGGAARATGGVPASSLKAYLEAETVRIAQEHGQDQRPEIVNGFLAAPEPVFGSALPEANVEIAFRPDRTGTIVLESPDLTEVKRGDASTGPWRLTLDRGLHQLRAEATGAVMDLRFRPAEGVLYVQF